MFARFATGDRMESGRAFPDGERRCAGKAEGGALLWNDGDSRHLEVVSGTYNKGVP